MRSFDRDSASPLNALRVSAAQVAGRQGDHRSEQDDAGWLRHRVAEEREVRNTAGVSTVAVRGVRVIRVSAASVMIIADQNEGSTRSEGELPDRPSGIEEVDGPRRRSQRPAEHVCARSDLQKRLTADAARGRKPLHLAWRC